jgi:glycerate kinase
VLPCTVQILIAPDEFGGTLSAPAAAAAIAAGWRAAAPGDRLDLAPLSDGGPGFVDVLSAALPRARRVPVEVQDPLGRAVRAELLLDGSTAYVESAQACGLHLLTADERDPKRTTTYGVGQLLQAAAAAGATRVVVGLGGSATNDGGEGMLAALNDLAEPLEGVELVAATDVDAPLLGIFGASAVFGPQKGATPDDVQLLDARLTAWADELEARAGRPVRDLPGAGAAGGLGAALLALGATRESGSALVQRLVRLARRVRAADLVVTGEGRFDASSLTGKVVSGVAASAAELGLPCLVLAGQVVVGRREAAAAGIEAAYAVADAVGLSAALERPAEELTALAERVAREWSRHG